ncbi:MAG: radical SAM protein [Candidatus Gastranaerophilales bacterium]|nr:radical SAM protein [Candidatus Gastranaerophilales bacterium]
MKKDWKILPNLYNAVISRKYPVSLIHFVTQRCNAKCPHCFIDFENTYEELNLEQIEKIASTTGPCLRNIALTGGEPFIRDDFFEIANIWYKNSSAQSVSVTTNGSMPSKIENFAKKAVLNEIPVSFFFSYDFIEDKHSQYRNLKNLHLNVKESYKIIKSFSPKLNATFQITLNPDNYESAFETYQYMRDVLKISNINCTMIRGEKASKIEDKIKSNISQKYEKIEKQINRDFDTNKLSGFSDKSLTAVLLNAKNKMLWKYVLKTFKENKYISPCRAGSLFGVIYSNGQLMPCEILNSKIGNLKDFDYNFLALWFSENAKQIRNYIKSSNCYCTFECSWIVNIFSSPQFYPELFYNIVKNNLRSKFY